MNKRVNIDSGAFIGSMLALAVFVILCLIGIWRAAGIDAAIWAGAGFACAIGGTCFYFAWR